MSLPAPTECLRWLRPRAGVMAWGLAGWLAGGAGVSPGWAQTTPDTVWRCGQLFTNQPVAGHHCEPTGSMAPTVIEGTGVGRPVPAPQKASRTGAAAPALPAPTGQPASPSSGAARALLQAELKEHEARLQHLLAQWNEGHPQPLNQQALGSADYQDRVSAMRQQLRRTEADVAALRRELSRLP